MKRVAQYFQIPKDYCHYFGSLHWAEGSDAAVETVDGVTFALIPEITLFLEGLMAGGRLLHFGHVLHLLHLLGLGGAEGPHEVLELRRKFKYGPDRVLELRLKFKELGRPLRNAGVFCARLCQSVPPVADPLDATSATRHYVTNIALVSLVWPALEKETAPEVPEEPPLPPVVFERLVLEALAACSPEELEHWLRHGCASGGHKGESLLRVIEEVPPATVDEVLDAVAQRPRLAGAAPYVGQMVSALALPPRRLAQPELPLGGFADVTNRGQPEQLLPSQFLVDDLEFVRRFAANELLFFRREEPHQRQRQELVLLLDQGVRTWGQVRLVLSAAVLALARRGLRQHADLRLAGTSNGGEPLDPQEAGAETIGDLLEASDLSLLPAAALERTLEEPATIPRDVVLLTQPRNLAEPDVIAAARRAMGLTRLFAVTVDEEGQAQLCELRRGAAVVLRSFRVQEAALPPTVPESDPEPQPSGAPNGMWRGDVEPVPFPFRFGAIGKLTHVTFDFSGDWLLTVGPRGMLYLDHVTGTDHEVLPRGFTGGQVLAAVEAVLGAAGGFVICGKLASGRAAFHYKLADRTCTAHLFPETRNWAGQWYYLRTLHSVVLRDQALCQGVDLDTGERGSHRTMSRNAASRVDRACAEAAWHIRPPPQIFVHAFNEPDPPRGATITLQPTTGVLRVSGLPLPWTETRPLADGRPVLQGCIIEDAQGSGDIVVVRTFRPDDGYQPTLRLLGGLEGAVLWEKANFRGIYALSRGPGPHRLARQIADSQVAVADVLNPSGTVCVTPVGKCHNQVEVELGQKEWLGIQVGHWVHLVRWDNQELTLSRSNKNLQTMLEDHNIFPNRRKAAVEVIPNVSQVKYDTHRFQAAARWGDLTAIVDRCGQVAIFDREKNLITMFFIHRDRIAAWMPDGTRLGPPSLTGGPVTPDAAMKIGRALREANARWGEWPP